MEKGVSMETYRIVKHYRDQAALRHSFCDLAVRTFGLDFEDWYQNGFWRDTYDPYSIEINGKIIANVSVNRTDFIWKGSRRHWIQLGTVMTDENYRKQGLIRRLMEEIERDCLKDADGVYLFANDSVLEFYPGFGFHKAAEYQYEKPVFCNGERHIEQVPMKDAQAWAVLEQAVKKSVPCGLFDLTGNEGLILFYVSKFMQENVYYDKEQDAYVIAEMENGELMLHGVFSEKAVDLNRIAEAFGREIRRVRLGFVPERREEFICRERKEEDTTLFIRGESMKEWEADRLMIPVLAHA